ncbi:MAG: sn-glycerol-3-phosphate ABC transporter ATP-binding protein UgpC [Alphaproteobacteria bacterium]|nr:sn-glycerol-3-phosphate ABC transporter ATP-binding protein UgpC [Alphaproteobacteria bacterium]
MVDLRLKNIKKSYGTVEVIKGIDLDIKHGEFVVFVGPSGCGKSTLLRMIAGLEDISDGDLYIGDKRCNDMQPNERGIAMVFQSYALYPHMTSYENIAFGLTLAKRPKAEIEKKVKEVAGILQMEDLLDRKPAQLSGGQRQRVAIGRAIIRQPDVFLFDEPLSNLDASLRMDMRMEIGKLHADLNATMVYVTHDQVEAMTLADKIVVLNDGYVQQVGTPMELFHNPANKFVAGFIGSPKMNFFEVKIIEVSENTITVDSLDIGAIQLKNKLQFELGQNAILGIRPQHLVRQIKNEETGQITGQVQLVERLGTETIVNVKLKSGAIVIASLNQDIEIARGEALMLGFVSDDLHLFST